jgi:hypothetical protein
VAFEGEADLHDAEAEKYQPDCTYQTEDECRKVVDHRYRVVCGKGRRAESRHRNYGNNRADASAKAPPRAACLWYLAGRSVVLLHKMNPPLIVEYGFQIFF